VADSRAEGSGFSFGSLVPDFRAGSVQPFIRQVIRRSRRSPLIQYSPRFEAACGRSGLALARSLESRHSLIRSLRGACRLTHRLVARRAVHWAAARSFLTQARDFARSTHLAEFLRVEQPTFDSASSRLERVIETRRG
jgi:hypothetical protein